MRICAYGINDKCLDKQVNLDVIIDGIQYTITRLYNNGDIEVIEKQSDFNKKIQENVNRKLKEDFMYNKNNLNIENILSKKTNSLKVENKYELVWELTLTIGSANLIMKLIEIAFNEGQLPNCESIMRAIAFQHPSLVEKYKWLFEHIFDNGESGNTSEFVE